MIMAANSPTPLYHRIYLVLREKIVNGYYPLGQAMPSEEEIAADFNVSRVTIRKAMELLTADRLVTRSRGRGTFVNARATENTLNKPILSNIQGFMTYLDTVGMTTDIKVISLDRCEVPPRLAGQLRIASDATVVRAVRVRKLQNTPYSLSVAYLLPEIGDTLTWADLEQRPMIELVRRTGTTIARVEQALTATLADEFAAGHLDVPVGAPLMRLNRTFFNADMVPFYAAEIFYRADLYEYRVVLGDEPKG